MSLLKKRWIGVLGVFVAHLANLFLLVQAMKLGRADVVIFTIIIATCADVAILRNHRSQRHRRPA